MAQFLDLAQQLRLDVSRSGGNNMRVLGVAVLCVAFGAVTQQAQMFAPD
jgi:hypothetical protein